MEQSKGNNMLHQNYDALCKAINNEFKKIKNPTFNNLHQLAIKFKVDVSVVRECVGLKDIYEFLIDKD